MRRIAFVMLVAVVGAAFAQDPPPRFELDTRDIRLTPPPARQPQSIQNDILRARVNTLYGPTGLITVPHAYVATQGRITLGTFFAENKSVSANYGLIDSIEVGGAYVDRTGMSNKSIANGKVNVIPANFKNIEIGVGIIDAIDAINQTFFVVASAELAPTSGMQEREVVGLRVHGGYGSGVFREEFIGGAEILFSYKVSVIGEWDGRQFNAGLRYVRDEALRLQVGILAKRLFFSTTYAFNF